jgi:ankyrin repeat protein
MLDRFLSFLETTPHEESHQVQDRLSGKPYLTTLTNDIPDAELESRDCDDNTSLIAATYASDTASMKELLDRGAMIEAQGMNGITALGMAAFWGREEAADLLIQYHADIDALTGGDTGRSPLAWAVSEGHAGMVKLLLARHAHVNVRDTELNTPLILAAALGRYEIAKILLEAGANPRLVGHNGFTAVTAAAAGGHQNIVHLLGGAPAPSVETAPVDDIRAKRLAYFARQFAAAEAAQTEGTESKLAVPRPT